jgi:hypothetical protein
MGRDRLGAAVRAHDPDAPAPAPQPAGTQRQEVIPGVPRVDDLDVTRAKQRPQAPHVFAVAHRAQPAAPSKVEARDQSRRLGLPREGAPGRVRRLRAREIDVEPALAKGKRQTQHRLGRSGPFPIAGELEDSHDRDVPRG